MQTIPTAKHAVSPISISAQTPVGWSKANPAPNRSCFLVSRRSTGIAGDLIWAVFAVFTLGVILLAAEY